MEKILLTRPQAASDRWAALLKSRGFDCLIEPLLVIEPTHAPKPVGDFQAVLLTSANAPDLLEGLRDEIKDLISLPCFCVGAVTGASARAAGFETVHCGATDSMELAKITAGKIQDKTRPLLHICGETTEERMREILTQNSYEVRSWPIYRAISTEDFSPATREAFATGLIGAIPVFSPRSARILVSLVEKNRLTQACTKITALGLSQAVGDVLQTLPWRALRIAASPSEEDVLVCLEKPMSQNENPPPLLPPVLNAPAPKKPGGFKNGLLTGIVLASMAAVAFLASPMLHPAPAPQDKTQIAALQQRIDTLEAHLNNLTEIPPVAPVASTAATDNSALAETVKNLQAQVAQLSEKNGGDKQNAQKKIAAAFAFWTMRDAAKQGHVFAAQLADLNKTAEGDAGLEVQIALLQPYAQTPTPSCSELRAALTQQESMLTPPVTQSENLTLFDRIKIAFRPLISIHPLHDPQLAPIEQDLDQGDADAALDAFKNLPGQTQKDLAAWQNKLEARVAIDAALRTMETQFAAPENTEGVAP